jgi:hypothetical protein
MLLLQIYTVNYNANALHDFKKAFARLYEYFVLAMHYLPVLLLFCLRLQQVRNTA